MHDDSSGGSAIDLRAVGAGVLWGLVLMVVGAIAQLFMGMNSPLSPEMTEWLALLWQVAGGLLGGFLAARRAASSGWLHGAMAGMALVLSIAAIMGVRAALPTLAALLKMAGIGTGAGLVGGILGVNLGRR